MQLTAEGDEVAVADAEDMEEDSFYVILIKLLYIKIVYVFGET